MKSVWRVRQRASPQLADWSVKLPTLHTQISKAKVRVMVTGVQPERLNGIEVVTGYCNTEAAACRPSQSGRLPMQRHAIKSHGRERAIHTSRRRDHRTLCKL